MLHIIEQKTLKFNLLYKHEFPNTCYRYFFSFIIHIGLYLGTMLQYSRKGQLFGNKRSAWYFRVCLQGFRQ